MTTVPPGVGDATALIVNDRPDLRPLLPRFSQNTDHESFADATRHTFQSGIDPPASLASSARSLGPSFGSSR